MSFEKVQIGDCTLYCGDSLEVLASLAPTSVDCVVTDPPYGINTKSDDFGKLSPWNDLCNSALWYAAWITECRRALRDNGSLWSCLNWRSLVTFQKAACDVRWPIESLAVWDKAWIGPGGQKGLRPSYELVALWCKPEFAVPDRGVPDVVRVKWSSHKPHGHPAEKPEGLMRWCLETAGLPQGSLVVDPFLGSGTTGEAAVRLGHRFIGIEQDAEWFAKACERIEAAQKEAGLYAQAREAVA